MQRNATLLNKLLCMTKSNTHGNTNLSIICAQGRIQSRNWPYQYEHRWCKSRASTLGGLRGHATQGKFGTKNLENRICRCLGIEFCERTHQSDQTFFFFIRIWDRQWRLRRFYYEGRAKPYQGKTASNIIDLQSVIIFIFLVYVYI